MNNISIVPIDNSNIKLLEDLLFQRNGTMKEYTRWKYNHNLNGRFKGLIAFDGNLPVGCFGSIPKKLIIKDKTINAGWFADWYVIPKYRGSGIGEKLLKALSDYESIMFGHPGPENARSICLFYKYNCISFQSRRRIILNKISYYTKKKILLSSGFSSIVNIIRNINLKEQNHIKEKLNLIPAKIEPQPSLTTISFAQTKKYEKWILNQPIFEYMDRKFSIWTYKGSKIKYFDEKIRNKEKRRLVLYISGEEVDKLEFWQSFVDFSKKFEIDYIELFTTNKLLDNCLDNFGAWNVDEAPIMCKGLDVNDSNLNIQPWDRENWIYLHSQRTPKG